jgi:hypothetical protein
MANFKLYSVAAAAFALASIASAQQVIPPSTCTLQPGNGANIVRAEGITEQTGEIFAACTAGPGGAINIQVQFPSSTTVTSRVLTGTTTEALLILSTGAVVNGTVSSSAPSIVNFAVTLPTTAFNINIANLRINAAGIGATQYAPVTPVLFSINNAIQVNLPTTVSYVVSGITKATVNGSTSASSTASITNPVVCSTRYGYTGVIYYAHFSEGFQQSFKTLGVTGAPSTEVINNSESGVTAAGAVAGTGNAGSATRLAVTISGLPNVTVYLPITIKEDNYNVIPAGSPNGYVPPTVNSSIMMISNPSLPTNQQAPVTGTTSGNSPDKGAGAYFAFTPTNGSVTAYYEVQNAVANVTEAYTVPVAVYFSGNTIPPTSAIGTLVSFAPVVAAVSGSVPVPSFLASSNSPTSSSKFTGCTTTLLYPYVVNAAGFDTGLTIANTSADPFGTVAQSGTCTLNYYNGTGTALPSSTPFNVSAGQVYANLVSVLQPGFTGYIIAQCNFQFAHGFAFITDGFASPGRGLSQGYLALTLADPNQLSRQNFVSASPFVEGLGN